MIPRPGETEPTRETPCGSCMGRGWSWVSSRLDLLVARGGFGRGPERRRESCTECGYTGRQTCNGTCAWGGCGGFSVNRYYDDVAKSGKPFFSIIMTTSPWSRP